jgi:hypothetical protein
MPNPFTNTGRIEDPRYFFGRTGELDAIFDRLGGVQLGSINVVGERRTGRSSLLWAVKTHATQKLPDRYKFAFLDLRLEGIDSPDMFRGYAMRELSAVGADKNQLPMPLRSDKFESELRSMREQQNIPVLLLDNFDSIVLPPKSFPTTFFSGLHALCDGSLLACLFVTRNSLLNYRTTHPAVSTLNGVCKIVSVGNFAEDEAQLLLSQQTDHTFTTEQKIIIRQWAGLHPLKLNLAASRIYQQLDKAGGEWGVKQSKEAEVLYRNDIDAYLGEPMSPLAKRRNIFAILWSYLTRFLSWLESHWKVASLFIITVAVIVLLVTRLIDTQQIAIRVRNDLIGTSTPSIITSTPSNLPSISTPQP